MSYHKCSNCGHLEHIFGHAGAKETAKEMGIDFLGEIPLHITIRETSDAGRPVTISDPKSDHAQAYYKIAEKIVQKVEAMEKEEEPKIVVE